MTTNEHRGQPALLRVLNDRAALELLLDEGPLTRNEIATRTGLSKPTAAEIIRRLEAAQLIRQGSPDSRPQAGRRGPVAAVYEVIIEDSLAVAVDVQLFDVRSTVVDASGRAFPVAAHRMSEEERLSDGAAIIDAAIDRASAAAGVDRDLITAVAVGVQASVNHATDSLTFTDGLPGWPRLNVSRSLAETLGVQVVIENDANLAAIAERYSDAGRDAESFAVLWIAEGLGMALDIGGQLHSGASGAAGEIGYLNVPADARHLDESATMISDLISQSAVIALGASTGLDVSAEDGLQWRQVLDQLAGLPDKHPFFTGLGERIGYNVLPVLAVADPEAVVLHGPTGIAGGPALAGAVMSWLRTRTRWSTPILPPSMTRNPVLHGARRVLIDVIRTALANRIPALDDDAPAPATAPDQRVRS